jgi:hypothetical protein
MIQKQKWPGRTTLGMRTAWGQLQMRTPGRTAGARRLRILSRSLKPAAATLVGKVAVRQKTRLVMEESLPEPLLPGTNQILYFQMRLPAELNSHLSLPPSRASESVSPGKRRADAP